MLPDILLLLFLAGAAVTDILDRRISIPYTCAFALSGVILSVTEARPAPDICLALIPGAALLAASFFSGGAVGCGDGLVLLTAACFAGFGRTVLLTAAAFILASAGAAVILIRRGGRNCSFPFVPFILAAWVILIL